MSDADVVAPVLLVEDLDGVRTLTFNRPEALNAFDQALWTATADALTDAARDDSVRCVVVTGAGRAFSAGQDLTEMSDPSTFDGQEPGYELFMPVLESFPKPLIAAVNGIGVGIGLTMLLHCDMVVMSDTARLKVPFISLGVTTEASASVLMPATMGWQRAAEVLFTEPWIDADQALADGIVLQVVPHDRLADEVRALAERVALLPLGPLLATKRLLLAGRADSVRSARLRELVEFRSLVGGLLGGGSIPGGRSVEDDRSDIGG